MSTSALNALSLREILAYDAASGAFTWKVSCGNKSSIGSIAGAITDEGYIHISINSKQLKAHRLAWLYVHGTWPICQIDHINGVRCDNRIANLREATRSENQQNLRSAMKNSQHGLLGVTPNGNKWQARIQLNGKRICLGNFSTYQLAHSAYITAKRQLHTACTI